MDATNTEPKQIARKPRAPRAKKVVAPQPPPPEPIDERPQCCLCWAKYDGYGNNPDPVPRRRPGEACDACNSSVVIPARIKQREEEAIAEAKSRWMAKDITIEELLVTDPAADAVLHGIREQVDFAGDDVLKLLVRNHRQTYAWYLYGPESTKKDALHDMEAEAVYNVEDVDHVWGYCLTKQHACISIYTNSLTAYDCWRAYLLMKFGHGGELHDADVDQRVWND